MNITDKYEITVTQKAKNSIECRWETKNKKGESMALALQTKEELLDLCDILAEAKKIILKNNERKS